MRMIMKEFSSFRDDGGYVFYENDEVFRKIEASHFEDFETFLHSGLSKYLIEKNLLIDFSIINKEINSFTVSIEKIPLISYPFEWSFSMLKDAALLTLKLQKIALSFGMSLKDASSYNVQFLNGRPIFIDITSFVVNKKRGPWEAYQQFCRHFLGPLALMAKTDISLNSLLKIHLDGIPLGLINNLLPLKAKFSLGLYLHLVLHHKYSKKYESKKLGVTKTDKAPSSEIIDNLTNTIKRLKYTANKTEWVDYYEKSVEDEYLNIKTKYVIEFLLTLEKGSLWDIGANYGHFSRIASHHSTFILASDIDPGAIENFYVNQKSSKEKNILPLIIDITNTGGGFGWENLERKSIFERLKVDTILALAVIHHLRITYAIPLDYLARFFSKNCKNLIIEFVPKTDEKVKILLQNRQDIFNDYTLESFLSIFQSYFEIINRQMVSVSNRELILMKTIE